MSEVKIQPLKAQRIEDIRDLRRLKIAGSYELVAFGTDDDPKSIKDVQGVRFICPCGCGNESWMPTNRSNGKPWEISGTLEAISMHPSVFQSGLPCKWHGWLKDGVWTSC